MVYRDQLSNLKLFNLRIHGKVLHFYSDPLCFTKLFQETCSSHTPIKRVSGIISIYWELKCLTNDIIMGNNGEQGDFAGGDCEDETTHNS